jgi:N-acetylmuramoyl-L-alanine amidase
MGYCAALILIVALQPTALTQAPAPPPPAAAEPSSAPPAAPPVPLILIDAAHGGTETGAILGAGNLEKDVTLAMARRLRQDLASRGLQVQMVRDGDTPLTTDQRAAVGNTSRPTLYVCLHATSQGKGIGVYSALLPSSGDDRGPFANWNRAQASVLTRSRSLQQQVAGAIEKTRFPVRSSLAPVRPLNSLAVPAIAIEVAPTLGAASQLATSDYQQMVSAILANAIVTVKDKLGSAP